MLAKSRLIPRRCRRRRAIPDVFAALVEPTLNLLARSKIEGPTIAEAHRLPAVALRDLRRIWEDRTPLRQIWANIVMWRVYRQNPATRRRCAECGHEVIFSGPSLEALGYTRCPGRQKPWRPA